jgi:hypothetical protein
MQTAAALSSKLCLDPCFVWGCVLSDVWLLSVKSAWHQGSIKLGQVTAMAVSDARLPV